MKIIKASALTAYLVPTQLMYCEKWGMRVGAREILSSAPRCWEVSQTQATDKKTFFFFLFILVDTKILLTNRKQHTNKVTKRPIYLFAVNDGPNFRRKKTPCAFFFVVVGLGMKAWKKCLWFVWNVALPPCGMSRCSRCSPDGEKAKRKRIIIII